MHRLPSARLNDDSLISDEEAAAERVNTFPPPSLKRHMTHSCHISSFSGSGLSAGPQTGNHNNSLGLYSSREIAARCYAREHAEKKEINKAAAVLW